MLYLRNIGMALIGFLLVMKGHAQSKCDLVKDCSLALCNRDTAAALSHLYRFRELYPGDTLLDNINFEIAFIYFQQRKTEMAKQVITSIIEQKNDPPVVDFNSCPWYYDSISCRRQLFFFQELKELQYEAAMILYEIYATQGAYDSALWVLNKAATDFKCRPYLPSTCRRDRLIRFSVTYEKLGQYQQAIAVLAPYIRTEQVTDQLLMLLKKYTDYDRFLERTRKIEDSLSIEYAPVGENPVENFEYNETGTIILRSISVKEYGRKVYWHFLGQKFLMTTANDYQSFRVKGEKGKRKLKPAVTDQQLLAEALEFVQNDPFYRKLFQ